MRCPKCRSDNHVVTQSKPHVVRRTRRCQDCGHSFVTHEGLDVSHLWVTKRNKGRVGFSQKRLADSIRKAAVTKLKQEDVLDLIAQVIEDLYAEREFYVDLDAGEKWLGDAEVTTVEIGEAVMRVLGQNPIYRATRMRYGLLFGRSNGSFSNAQSFLEWLQRDQNLRSMKLPPIPERVVKRSGRTDDFEADKLRNSVKFAVRKRPVEEAVSPGAKRTNDELIDTIYRLILARLRGQRTVTSGQIAAATMRVLLASDDPELAKLMTDGDRELAYLRVASSAKRFTRAEDFQAEALLLIDHAKDVVPSGFEESPERARAVSPGPPRKRQAAASTQTRVKR